MPKNLQIGFFVQTVVSPTYPIPFVRVVVTTMGDG